MQELSLKELQHVSLDIMKEVHRFCVENKIRYSIAGGTLIGAIRHKGFIPWDDDVDLMMPRPDFERFCKTFRSDKLDFIYYGNDKTAIACFARPVDTKRTIYKTERPWTIQDSGVWIDIFPVDGVEESQEAFTKRYNKLCKWRDIAYKFRRQNHHISKGDSAWSIAKTYIAKVITLGGIIPAWIIGKMVKNISQYDYDSSKNISQYSDLIDGPIIYDKKDFEDFVLVDFEDSQFYAVKGYDHLLRQIYGDYMQLPPEEDRQPKQYWIHFYWRSK